MNNKLIFLGIIFIALLSFMVFSDDSEEVDNDFVSQQEKVDNDFVSQQERNVPPEVEDQLPSKPKSSLGNRKKIKKSDVYKKIIFIEIVVIFGLILTLIILSLFFNFCKQKIDEDEKAVEKILYFLEQQPIKKEIIHRDKGENDMEKKDNQQPENPDDGIDFGEFERKQKEIEEQKKIQDEKNRKQLERQSFEANVSLNIKVSEDKNKIIIFHSDKNSNEDFEYYKMDTEQKSQEIAGFLKQSFTLERDNYSNLLESCKDAPDVHDPNESDEQAQKVDNKKFLNLLLNFIDSFIQDNDSDNFLKKVAEEIQGTLKILTLEKNQDKNVFENSIDSVREQAPTTYYFLSRFKSQKELNEINNIDNINNNIGDGDGANDNGNKRKQLIFNCFEHAKNGNGGVISNESDIKEDAFSQFQDDDNNIVITKKDNGEIWNLIQSLDYKGYISKSLEILGIKNGKIALLNNIEICPFKTLLNLLNIIRSVVREIDSSVGEVAPIKVSVMNIKSNYNNAYGNFFNNVII